MKDKYSNFLTIDPLERKRFDRQLRLPGWNQRTLKDAIVIIAGIGGLGTEIAKNLAMTGVGTMHLVDMDIIEYSNLNRQILFTDADEGEPKAQIAAKNLKKINPFGTYIPHYCTLEELDPKIYEAADLYIAGLDSVQSRRELIRRAVHNRKPLIDGGTATYYGHVYTYLPGKNACLECDPMKEQERETLAACTLVGIPRRRIHCLLKGQLYFEATHERLPQTTNLEEMKAVLDYANKLVVEHFPKSGKFSMDEVIQSVDHHDPTIITINAVIASLQSQEALKVIHHVKGSKLGHLSDEYTIYNGLTGKFYSMEKPANKNCQLCGSKATKVENVQVPSSTTMDTILYMIKNKGYWFDEEFPPNFFRIDLPEMDVVETDITIAEIGIKSGETLFLSGLRTEGRETDLYVKVYLK